MQILKPLYLASSSPRRRDLMTEYQIPFEIVKSTFQEPKLVSPYNSKQHQEISYLKAKNAVLKSNSGIVISADTVGVKDGLVLEKPKDENDAFEMLMLLRGSHHDVITSVTLLNVENGDFITESALTRVYFKNVPEKWIEEYIASGEPMDKAAAYAIQGKGEYLVDHYEGDYTNIVGLPMPLLIRMLQQMNAIIP